jgi:hypothetical protein
MCKMSEESINYILIHCELARELWSSILDLFGRKACVQHIIYLDMCTS